MTNNFQACPVVTMVLTIKVDEASGWRMENLHEERVSLIFPESGKLHLGGSSLTEISSHAGISHHLNMEAWKRMFPGARGQTDGIRKLREDLQKTGLKYIFKTWHMETRTFFCPVRAAEYIQERDTALNGPIFNGRYI